MKLLFCSPILMPGQRETWARLDAHTTDILAFIHSLQKGLSLLLLFLRPFQWNWAIFRSTPNNVTTTHQCAHQCARCPTATVVERHCNQCMFHQRMDNLNGNIPVSLLTKWPLSVQMSQRGARVSSFWAQPKQCQRELSVTPLSFATDTMVKHLQSADAFRSFSEFRQEASMLHSLLHPCIVSLVGISIHPLCFALQLAPLGSLNTVLEERRKGKSTHFHP